jgi:D-alanine-D-alanine ligase-like ATP-grasp enzyme
MSKIKVGVLRGGIGNGYNASLATGKAVLDALPKDAYDAVDIFIDTQGQWHVNGYPLAPNQAVRRADVVYNGLFGSFAAEIQHLLHRLGAHFAGSRGFGLASALHRPAMKKIFADNGIRTPMHTVYDATRHTGADILRIFRTFPHPSLVSPASSDRAAVLASSYQELFDAVSSATESDAQAVIEMYVPGTEVISGVIEGYRGKPHYTLLPMTGDGVLARLSPQESDAVQELTARAHAALGLSQYSQSHCVVSPRGAYLLTVTPFPPLAQNAPFVGALREVGVSLPHFLDHVISLSRE